MSTRFDKEILTKAGENMLHILICDDDRTFADFLSQQITLLPEFDRRCMKITTLDDPRTIDKSVIETSDLIFLDIDMGDINGLSLARKMRSISKSFILIFVTNYGEYAAEGYEVNAFRFLPKLQLKVKLPDYFSKALAACQSKNRTINVFCEGESTSVFLDQLVYAETDGRAAILHINGTPPKALKVRMSLRSMEDKLCDEGFLRIHNSYLVNMNYLSSLQTSGATLTTGETLPLSLHNYRAIKSKYLEWKGRT